MSLYFFCWVLSCSKLTSKSYFCALDMDSLQIKLSSNVSFQLLFTYWTISLITQISFFLLNRALNFKVVIFFFQGWGHGSGGQVLVTHAWRLEFGPRCYITKLTHAFVIPALGRQRHEGIRALQASLALSMSRRPVRGTVSKNNMAEHGDAYL